MGEIPCLGETNGPNKSRAIGFPKTSTVRMKGATPRRPRELVRRQAGKLAVSATWPHESRFRPSRDRTGRRAAATAGRDNTRQDHRAGSDRPIAPRHRPRHCLDDEKSMASNALQSQISPSAAPFKRPPKAKFVDSSSVTGAALNIGDGHDRLGPAEDRLPRLDCRDD